MSEHCYCGQIKPHAHTPQCEKPRVRVCPACTGEGTARSLPGILMSAGNCQRCNGAGTITVNGDGKHG